MKTSVDHREIEKFRDHSNQWWDSEGAFKTLHDINETRVNFIQSYVDLAKLRVLDVGCGGGILAERLFSLGAQVTGIDAEPEAICAAKHHAKASQLLIDYYESPIENFVAQPFDAITSMELLEHVADPSFVLCHCARLLKPQGLLFLSTINRTVKAYMSVILGAEYLLKLLPKRTHDYAKFITPSELASMARKQGFEVIGLSGLDYDPFSRRSSLIKSVTVNYLMVCRLT